MERWTICFRSKKTCNKDFSSNKFLGQKIFLNLGGSQQKTEPPAWINCAKLSKQKQEKTLEGHFRFFSVCFCSFTSYSSIQQKTFVIRWSKMLRQNIPLKKKVKKKILSGCNNWYLGKVMQHAKMSFKMIIFGIWELTWPKKPIGKVGNGMLYLSSSPSGALGPLPFCCNDKGSICLHTV